MPVVAVPGLSTSPVLKLVIVAVRLVRFGLSPSNTVLTRPSATLTAPVLLQVVVQESVWQDGGLRTTLFEPFEILRHSNRESLRKEKENGGSGRDLEVWLLR